MTDPQRPRRMDQDHDPFPGRRHPPPLGGRRGEFMRWSTAAAVAAAEFAARRIRSWGLPCDEGSRLIRAQHLIAGFDHFSVRVDPGSGGSAQELKEAHRSVFEIYAIVRQMQAPDKVTRRYLRTMLRAPDLPAFPDDPGRDYQAELFARVLFEAAGYTVRRAEPDLILTRASETWGAAVKRVKSARQFRARVQEAQRQLKAAGLLGFVVVNPELLLGRESETRGVEELRHFLFDNTGDWISYLDPSMVDQPVRAAIALGTNVMLVRDGTAWRLAFSVYFHPRFVVSIGSADEQRAVAAACEEMGAALAQSLPNLRNIPT